jgi:hypothetical protein
LSNSADKRVFQRGGAFGRSQALAAKWFVCSLAVSSALGAAEASTPQAPPASAIAQRALNSVHDIRDLGVLPPPADSDNSTPTPTSALTVSSAEPVPELSTWAMILLCFAGLGLARFKRGRKDRLSPGID